MDPHAVLGVAPGASADEITSAYRKLAKRWHPDRAPGAAAEARMVEINAAYELLRSEAWQVRNTTGSARRSSRPSVVGQWLDASTRRALGPELLAALRPQEGVRLVTPVSVWASPQALLTVTETRLLWLLDDAVTGRVRTLDLAAVTGVETRLSWPRRRTASLRVSRRDGRRPVSFGELRPETARAISSLVRGAAVAA
jgi:hypothetical protein